MLEIVNVNSDICICSKRPRRLLHKNASSQLDPTRPGPYPPTTVTLSRRHIRSAVCASPFHERKF